MTGDKAAAAPNSRPEWRSCRETNEGRQMKAGAKSRPEWRSQRETNEGRLGGSGRDFGDQQPNLWEVRTPISSSYLGKKCFGMVFGCIWIEGKNQLCISCQGKASGSFQRVMTRQIRCWAQLGSTDCRELVRPREANKHGPQRLNHILACCLICRSHPTRHVTV